MDSIPSGVPLSAIPVSPPPPGDTPNFINPTSYANTLIVVNVVFLVIMLITLTLRIFTKGMLLHSLGWDDYTAMIGAAGSIAHSGVVIEQTRHGLGRHQWDIPISYLLGNDIHAETVISFPTYLFVKVSILLLYYRLFSIDRNVRYLIWTGIILQVIGYTAFTGCAIGLEVICTDAAIAKTNTFCVNSYKVAYTQSLFSVVTDFYVLLLPVGVVLKLQLSPRRKIGVILVFMTGLLACVASIIRAVVSIQTLHTTDTLREAGYVSIFSAVEMNTGIIAAALTTLPIFLSKSGAVSFGKSALSSVRNRLFSRSKTSLFSNKPAGSGSKFKVHNKEESYVELNKVAPWQDGGKEGMSERDIIRTDDYEISTHPDPNIAKAYVPV